MPRPITPGSSDDATGSDIVEDDLPSANYSALRQSSSEGEGEGEGEGEDRNPVSSPAKARTADDRQSDDGCSETEEGRVSKTTTPPRKLVAKPKVPAEATRETTNGIATEGAVANNGSSSSSSSSHSGDSSPVRKVRHSTTSTPSTKNAHTEGKREGKEGADADADADAVSTYDKTSTPASPMGDTSSEEECIKDDSSSSGHGDGESNCDSSEGSHSSAGWCSDDGSVGSSIGWCSGGSGGSGGLEDSSDDSNCMDNHHTTSASESDDASLGCGNIKYKPPSHHSPRGKHRLSHKRRPSRSPSPKPKSSHPKHRRRRRSRSQSPTAATEDGGTGQKGGTPAKTSTKKKKSKLHAAPGGAYGVDDAPEPAAEIARHATRRVRGWARSNGGREQELLRAADLVDEATSVQATLSAVVGLVTGVCNAADELLRKKGDARTIHVSKKVLGSLQRHRQESIAELKKTLQDAEAAFVAHFPPFEELASARPHSHSKQ